MRFWISGTFSGIHLHAEIPPRHHDAVGSLENGGEILHRLGFLDLGDDAHAALFPIEPFLEVEDVGGLLDKGEGQIVDLLTEAEAEIFEILFRHGGDGDAGAGKVDPLAILEGAADHHLAAHVFVGHGERPQFEQAVVEQNRVARLDIIRQAFVITGNESPFPEYVAGGENHFLAGAQGQGTVAEMPDADFRPLQVGENGHRLVSAPGKFAQAADDARLARVVAVGKVQAKDVGAGFHQSQQHLFGFAGGSDRGDDLGAPVHESSSPGENRE